MSSAFTSSAAAVHPGSFGPPTAPSIAAAATRTGDLVEKSLELTFCSQFAAEIAYHHYLPPWHSRIVWFGLTQLQENQLGFDAVTSLGGFAAIFQFKASHTVTKKCGRRFKVDHDQLDTLQKSFGQFHGTCFYVFPDVGNVRELAHVHSNVVGNSWLVDAADLPDPVPQPRKSNGGGLRRDNCHYAFLGRPPMGTVEFHSDPFRVRASRAKDFGRRQLYPEGMMPTEKLVYLLNEIRRASPEQSHRFFRNTVMAVFTDTP